jgi:YggT family protein
VPAATNSLYLTIAQILGFGLTIYIWIVVIRAIISWFSPSPHNPVVQFLARVTDPVLYHVRRIIPAYYGGIDFSPVILILLLVFLNDFAVTSLKLLGMGHPTGAILPVFLISVIRLVQGVLFAFMIILIIRAVLSWISPDPYNPIVRFVYGITEPLLYRLRQMIPLVYGGVDFTPILVIALIYFVNTLLDKAMIAVSQSLVM